MLSLKMKCMFLCILFASLLFLNGCSSMKPFFTGEPFTVDNK
jgi:hypothetical protein